MTIVELSGGEDHRAVLDGISWETYERLLEDIGEGHTRLTYDDGKLEIESGSPGEGTMAIVELSPLDDEHVVLDGISWETYEQMLDDVGDGHLRLTYDEGRLEIMSPSGEHEFAKKVLARLIEHYCYEMGIPIAGYGSTTFKSRRKKKGLEPDECYYISHPKQTGDIDLTVDPPPDLAIEVDITTRSVRRQPIYAALGVAEIWRYDGKRVHFLHRLPAGVYESAQRSLAFPDFPLDVVNELLRVGLDDQNAAVLALAKWIGERRRS